MPPLRKTVVVAIWLLLLAIWATEVVIFETRAAESPSSNLRKVLVVSLDGTGDYRSIQDAIDQAPGGATIRIKAGEYQEDITVHSKDGIQVAGDGAQFVTLLGRNRVGTLHIGKWPYGATNVEISGLTIKEHGGLALGVFNGRQILLRDLRIQGMLFGQQVEDVRIERCLIGGSETTGVQFADSQATLTENVIHDNDHGVTIAGKSDIRLERNVITRNLFEGVVVTDEAHAVVVRNTIVKNGGGVAFLGRSRSEASGNIIGLNRAGILIAPSSTAKLAHNALYNGENNYARPGTPVVGAPELKAETDLIVDPGFVDAGRGDFRLSSGTPLTEIGGFSFLGALPPVEASDRRRP
jgi:hypothetical protein